MHPTHSVLIVDDEPNVRLMLRTTLESSGYRIAEAPDGLEALAHLREAAFDLVLLDLRMPKARRHRDAVPPPRAPRRHARRDAHGARQRPRRRDRDEAGRDRLPHQAHHTPGAAPVVAEVIRRHEEQAAPSPLVQPPPAVHPRSFGFELARAKRAINRGEFEEAERLLREVLAQDPDSRQADELLDRLLTLKEREGSGTFHMLREWFPGGVGRVKR